MELKRTKLKRRQTKSGLPCTGKLCFQSLDKAQLKADVLIRVFPDRPYRAYKCPQCPSFHLTSQSFTSAYLFFKKQLTAGNLLTGRQSGVHD